MGSSWLDGETVFSRRASMVPKQAAVFAGRPGAVSASGGAQGVRQQQYTEGDDISRQCQC